jgi:hypothetical protein
VGMPETSAASGGKVFGMPESSRPVPGRGKQNPPPEDPFIALTEGLAKRSARISNSAPFRPTMRGDGCMTALSQYGRARPSC